MQTHTPSISFQKETVLWNERRDCLQSHFHSRIIDECILLIYQLNYFICYLTLSLCSNILYFRFKTCSKNMWERKVFFSVPLFDPHYQVQTWQSTGRSQRLNRSYSIPGEGSRLRLYRKQSLQKVSLLTQVKNSPATQEMPERGVWSLGWEDPLEKKMVISSRILALRIPRTEEPGGLQSMQSQRVRQDWVPKHSTLYMVV